jgi:exopolysaccharide biosynthesis protein
MSKNDLKQHRLNKLFLLIVLLMLFAGTSAGSIHASGSVDYQTAAISYNGKSFALQLITVDLKDPYLRIMPVTALEGLGHVESFSSMLSRSDAVAGINGTFFDSFEQDETKRYPNGLMIQSGETIHSGANQAFTVNLDKSPAIEYMKTNLNITVKHNGVSPYTFSPWGVNKDYGSAAADQVVLYTREFGESVSFLNGTKIIVKDNHISEITTQSAVIPLGGQVIYIGNTSSNNTYITAKMHVGDEVQLQPTVKTAEGTSSSAYWETAIGVGPKLLTNGQVDIDFARDGFTDPKLTTSANVRSFVGIDKADGLVMGTISSATLTEMAYVLQKQGLVDAMNMDGGASSALFYEGSIKRAPGRLLSDALVVMRYVQPQVQIIVNDQFVEEFRGYMQQAKTMVPFRGIFERIHADFKWDAVNSILTAQKDGTTLVLRPDNPIAEVNGTPVSLEVPPTILDNHIYIPLRFVVETLGAAVTWDQVLYRASIKIN